MARRPKKTKHQTGGDVPSKQDIIDFVNASPEKVGKREIARAFNIKGSDRVELKRLLRELADDGLISGNRKRLRTPGTLPKVTLIDITGRDRDGELVGVAANWDEAVDGPAPRALVLTARRGVGKNIVVGVGDRVLARTERLDEPAAGGIAYIARPMKKLRQTARRSLGIYRAGPGGEAEIQPVDKRNLRSWQVAPNQEVAANNGDLVRFELTGNARLGRQRAKICEVIGNPNDQKQISLIAVHAHAIPDEFPCEIEEELASLPPLRPQGREDLREVPLVTIDPADARDHDDAVWAAGDADEKNEGGWQVIVAIADVAHYVRPGSALDSEARRRGNSVYFPDRVVPMLPEKISNDLCSLREDEDRPCLAVKMTFDRNGVKRGHRFVRGIMRSHARLSYEDAQAAIDGTKASDKAIGLLESVLQPLWDAYASLKKARDKRAPLDLDLPERKIVIGEDGRVARIFTPERLTAHRLIEEFMIQANVAAAETLEAKRSPLIYRVHDAPSREKLSGLRRFLETMDIALPKAGTVQPQQFNRILAGTREGTLADLVSEIVLRSQSQAVYAHQNGGHFGLNLVRYAHFTSPIRRYADLIVHRALIAAQAMGKDGLTDAEIDQLGDIAEEISQTERRAMVAERETIDRLIAAHLSNQVGNSFEAKISGVTGSGLFVRLRETGADGFIPISSLGDEFFVYDEARHLIFGRHSNHAFRLGDQVEVRLLDVVESAGAMRFEMLSEGVRLEGPVSAPGPTRRGRRGRAGRRY